MFAIAVILFREVFEIALIVGVIAAATKNLPERTKIIGGGFVAGILSSAILALFTNNISTSLNGVGHEVFSAVTLFLAIIMIGWTVVWMKTHSRKLSAKFKTAGLKASTGEISLFSISLIIALAMLREGAEIILFVHGVIATNQATNTDIAFGALIGCFLGGVAGILVYLGIVRVSTKHLFKVTSWLLMLIGAGMATQLTKTLSNAGFYEAGPVLWDSSSFISESSIVGKAFQILVGYNDHPTATQILFYIATFSLMVLLSYSFDTKAKG